MTESYNSRVISDLTRRELIRRAAVVGGGVVAAGSGFSPLMGAATANAAGMRSTITVGLPSTPSAWDPDTDFGVGELDVIWALNERLAEWKTEKTAQGGFQALPGSIKYAGLLEPRLAKSWTIKGNTIVFELRQGVMSHAGNEFTSADVYYHFQRGFALGASAAFFSNLAGLHSIAQVKILGKYAIQVTIEKEPVDMFMMGITVHYSSILDSAVVKAHATTADPWGTTFVETGDAGFGRYKLGSYESGNQLVLQAFTGSYLGAPPTPTIILKEVPTDGTRIALLERGDLDFVQQLLPTEYKSVSKAKGTKVWNFSAPIQAAVLVDHTFAPLNNLLVREALAYATPYDQILNQVFAGYGKRSGGPQLSQGPGYKTFYSDKFNTNLAKAKALLKQAKVGKFSLEIAYDTVQPVEESIALILQSSFAEIGVTLKLVALDDAAWSATLLSKVHSQKYPLLVLVDGPFVLHPYYSLDVQYQSSSPVQTTELKIPKVDSLLAEMSTKTVQGSIPLAIEVQKILSDYVAWLYIAEPGIQYATGSYVQALTNYIGWPDYRTLKATS